MPKASDYGVDDVLQVITETFGLDGNKRGDEYDVLCVNPNHNETSPSCSINLVTGYWNCFSCGAGGDLAKLGQMVLGQPLDAVAGLLRPSTPEARLSALQRRLAGIQWKPPRHRRSAPLPEYPPIGSHPDLTARYFTTKTLEEWGVGWCEQESLVGHKGKYVITNSIAIPIKDEDGNMVAWCYRATSASSNWQPRYLYTPGVEISETWFGLDRAKGLSRITVVEGALDAMWMRQCGFPALGLLGGSMGDRKIKWLEVYREGAYLFPDLDKAGMQWYKRVTQLIGHRTPLFLCRYQKWMMKKRLEPDGTRLRATDPEDLIRFDVEYAHATAVPWVATHKAWGQQSHLT